MVHYAHTKNHPVTKEPLSQSEWEPLFTPFGEGEGHCQKLKCPKCEALEPQHGHLNKVAYWTAKFAAEMFPPNSAETKAAQEWGWIAGLWHDLGKFAPEWQTYLASKADPHQADVGGKVDHSSAGAQFANKNIPHFGTLFAYVIAGHHAGIGNGIDDSASCLERRLAKDIPEYLPAVPTEILTNGSNLLPLAFALQSGRPLAFTLRMLFSALVDADFLATEAFMQPDKKRKRRECAPAIVELEEALNNYLNVLSAKAEDTPVNRIRAEILSSCRAAASQEPGMFSLTVPTGGGKTLSSLAFALEHARLNDLRRVIYVIPFTSIIEQNAGVFREALSALGPDVVIEHHSNLDPDSKYATTGSRLAAENWDARVIVTTNVQFFESLYANKTSRCRKLHRIARSVIILDEVQALPLEFLDPCLRTLDELSKHYGSTIVLCTATQPAITRRDEFPIGLNSQQEIIPDPQSLYRKLRRVTANRIHGRTSDADLIEKVSQHSQVLCIVNTRRHARLLFEKLPQGNDGRFHLSALMCPEHRTEVLAEIKGRLVQRKPIRLITTQLIEAGVDIDFPVVFRALAGLDSIAQAAGRCDREGLLTEMAGEPAGQLFVFESDSAKAPPFVTTCANATSQVFASTSGDFLGLDSIEDYFRRHYWDNLDATDQKHILDYYPSHLRAPSDLLCFRFKQCAQDFQLIEDYTEPVLIPYGKKGEALCEELRETFDPTEIRVLSRKLQRFTVAIPKDQHMRLRSAGIVIPLHEERFHLLNSTAHYTSYLGLHPEPDLQLTSEQSIV